MKPTVRITKAEYNSFQRMAIGLKENESWRGKIQTQVGFSKEDKEALNVIIFACLKEFMLPKDIDLSAFPAFVLKRLYRKAYTWDSKPENSQFLRNEIRECIGITEEDPDVDWFVILLENYVRGKMEKEGVGDFAAYIWEEADKLPKEAVRIFKASRVLGTLIEYEEVQSKLRPDTAEETRQRVYSDLNKYADLPHFMEIAEGLGEYRRMKTLFRTISSARYTFRWQYYICPVRCSILTHMLESAMISYIANLETGRETDLLQDFWVMMFHDLAEVWTDDIPSPVKDGIFIPSSSNVLFQLAEKWTPDILEKIKSGEIKIGDGILLRIIAERQELWALDTYFYSQLPECCVAFFKKGIMLEDVEDDEKKRFYKAADYFSADLEVYWNIKGGSHEQIFYNILCRSILTGNRTSAEKALLEDIVNKCSGIVFLD